MLCWNCGEEETGNATFCRNCGVQLTHNGFADVRVFAGIFPEAMKRPVAKAVKKSKKSGLFAANAAAWGRPKFKGDTMNIAVRDTFTGEVGIEGSIRVTACNLGCRVSFVWYDDTRQSREVTGLFWQNLDGVISPGNHRR